MVDAVGYVMKSERVLREAAESVRIVDPDPVAIARNLDIERYNETQIIEISLNGMTQTQDPLNERDLGYFP